ncbi:MAG: hypothetical protein ACLPGW_16130 [Roseiarcus sp.]
MLYDFSLLWIWLLAAAAIGGVVGWTTDPKGLRRRWLVGWLGLAPIAFVVGLVVAWLHWLPGRSGFWLETALLFFASYVVGGFAGGLLKSAAALSISK